MTKTIGIVGGGQLGRMLTVAAHKLGFKVIVLDPTPNSPAGQVADKQILGSFKSEEKINELAGQSDYMTFEIESANAKSLQDLTRSASSGQASQINPSAKTLDIIKDKYKQKEFLKKNKIPIAESISVLSTVVASNQGERGDLNGIAASSAFGETPRNDAKEEIKDIAKQVGYPFVLKARFDAYDGRGNFVVKNEKEIDFGLEKLKHAQLYVEKFVPFVKELAVMVARSTVGEILTYPVVETTHKHNICHTVVVPAPVSEEVTNKARALGVKVMEALHGAGVFGIEMFVTKDGQVLVNEIAPRVHNSGHYTIEACKTSQFEQHIRAITGMELGPTDLIVPAAAMVNILGEREGSAEQNGVTNASEISGVTVHMYGKKEVRLERKMGHITAVANTPEEALEKALRARSVISI